MIAAKALLERTRVACAQCIVEQIHHHGSLALALLLRDHLSYLPVLAIVRAERYHTHAAQRRNVLVACAHEIGITVTRRFDQRLCDVRAAFLCAAERSAATLVQIITRVASKETYLTKRLRRAGLSARRLGATALVFDVVVIVVTLIDDIVVFATVVVRCRLVDNVQGCRSSPTLVIPDDVADRLA